MGVLSFIGGLVGPVTKMVDDLHTSGEEKAALLNELVTIENQFSAKVLDYEARVTEMRSNIIIAEAKGQSWLQRNWRPLTMLTFLVLICCHYAGVLAFEIADQMWTLLQIGIGGYIGGRSAEKIIPNIVSKLTQKGT